MQNTDHIPWVEKHRPRKVNGVFQDENTMEFLKNCTINKKIPHLIFYGPPGTGKTSAALALGRELYQDKYNERVIEFNASDDRGINAVREKISLEAVKYVSFSKSLTGETIPPYKMIILDEADSMTDEAQSALRVIVEEHSNITRFCFICNYITRITDAIKSRCSVIYFKKLDTNMMLKKLENVAVSENILLEKNILEKIINVSSGDMRKAIMLLQNVKYLYEYKNLFFKPFNKMNNNELKAISEMSGRGSYPKDNRITEKDIYNITGSIDDNMAENIVRQIVNCKKILELSELAKNIISLGFPVDNVILMINNNIIKRNDIKNTIKPKIVIKTTEIIYKLKESSNEYIQLFNYIIFINEYLN